MKAYISGPISGHDLQERARTFEEAEVLLRQFGLTAFNPMKNGLPTEADSHQHMHRDIAALLDCDYIYMLPGWLHSAGCKLEFDVATACGLQVMFAETGDLVKFR